MPDSLHPLPLWLVCALAGIIMGGWWSGWRLPSGWRGWLAAAAALGLLAWCGREALGGGSAAGALAWGWGGFASGAACALCYGLCAPARVAGARPRPETGKGTSAPADGRPTPGPTVSATKDQPFANSLGMRFVPVVGGPTGGGAALFSVWQTRVENFSGVVSNAAGHRSPDGVVPVVWNGTQWERRAGLQSRAQKRPGIGRASRLPVAVETMIRAAAMFAALYTIGEAGAAPARMSVGGVNYQVLRAAPSSIRIIWQDTRGVALRSFPAVARYLSDEGFQVDTVMNGGIFERGGVPSGLLVQNGLELRPVNRNHGEGNFFLLPNGVFLTGAARAAVIRTDEYPPKDMAIRHAVQSGPLLLRAGEVHPAFNAGSTSRLHRNGVGVAGGSEVVLAMTAPQSPKLPNLYEFALLFRALGCADALFLDGNLSEMRWGADLREPSGDYGSFIAVTVTPDEARMPRGSGAMKSTAGAAMTRRSITMARLAAVLAVGGLFAWAACRLFRAGPSK